MIGMVGLYAVVVGISTAVAASVVVGMNHAAAIAVAIVFANSVLVVVVFVVVVVIIIIIREVTQINQLLLFWCFCCPSQWLRCSYLAVHWLLL